MHEIISRKEALARGLAHYFTGEQCSRGHASARRVRGSVCMECARDAAKAYYEKNRETCLEKNRAHQEKNKYWHESYRREYYSANRSEILKKSKDKRDADKESVNARTRANRSARKAEADFGPPKPTRTLWNAVGKSICGECGDVKPVSDFASGLYRCKPCNARVKREYAAANPAYKERQRAKAAAKAGREYSPMPNKRGINTRTHEVPRAYKSFDGAVWYFRTSARLESAHDGQARLNAEEAWRHHLAVRASDSWVSRYFELRGDPWANPRLSGAEYYRMRYALDPEFNLRERLRRQITKKRKRDGVSDVMRRAIRTGGESSVIEKLFGYTITQLKAHLESHFHDGMDWPAFMRGEIHIDHIKPQAAFDLLDDDQYRQCWALSNLRPLWAADNLAKSDFMPCGRRARDARLAA
jgi:hypothetical protein